MTNNNEQVDNTITYSFETEVKIVKEKETRVIELPCYLKERKGTGGHNGNTYIRIDTDRLATELTYDPNGEFDICAFHFHASGHSDPLNQYKFMSSEEEFNEVLVKLIVSSLPSKAVSDENEDAIKKNLMMLVDVDENKKQKI